MGMVMEMEMQWLVMYDDALASNDPCSSKDDALCKFPLHILSIGEVSVSCGISECRISDTSFVVKLFHEVEVVPHGTCTRYVDDVGTPSVECCISRVSPPPPQG
jgi:hypothetical protein